MDIQRVVLHVAIILSFAVVSTVNAGNQKGMVHAPVGKHVFVSDHFERGMRRTGQIARPPLLLYQARTDYFQHRRPVSRATRTVALLGGARGSTGLASSAETADCAAPGSTPSAAEAAGLSGTALVNYFVSKPNYCTAVMSDLFTVTSQTLSLYKESNVQNLANAVLTRAMSYSVSNQQGVLSLMSVLRAAYYVQWNSGGALPAYGAATTNLIGDGLARMAQTPAFLDVSEAGSETVAGVFDLAAASQQGDRVVVQLLSYANAVLNGGDSYKTEGHSLATNSMYQLLFRHNANKPAAWLHWVELQQISTFEPLRRLSFYLAYTLTHDNGRWRGNAQAAVSEYTRLLTFPHLKAGVENNLQAILNGYAKFSAPWMAVAVNVDYYQANCSRFNICRSTLTPELKALAFPNSYSFDDGKVVIYSSLGRNKAQQLYHAMKQVEAQFKRYSQQATPIDGDPNAVLKMYIYGTRSEYENFQRFLFNLDTNNGGMYIEQDGTFYTYERTTSESVYTLEELLRHEYVHYLSCRYTVPGMWGNAPYYTNERLTWFEEGIAEFFAGATQADGIARRRNKIEGVAGDGANRMTVAEIVSAKYGNFRFYDYATVFMYYLTEKRPLVLEKLFKTLRAGDIAGFDGQVASLKQDGTIQSEFSIFTDKLVAEYAGLPAFQESPAYDPDTFYISDPTKVQVEFSKVIPGATCSRIFSAINQRVGCSGILSTAVVTDTYLNGAIKQLLATGINNWRTLNCHYSKSNIGNSYYCELGIRDSAIAQKINNKPVLVNAGSTVSVKSGETACLRANASDADGDLLVGGWRQKSGIAVPLGSGQTDVKFGACIYPAPNVSKSETVVMELRVSDGKDEVTMTHSLTINPAGVQTTPMPDVIVEDIWLDPSSPAQNQSVSVYARVKNQGNASTGNIVGVGFRINGEARQNWWHIEPAMIAGESKIFKMDVGYSVPASANLLSIMAIADDVNRFAESNENNNALSKNIAVLPAPGSLPLISNIGRGYQLGSLRTGQIYYTDRTYTLTYVPESLTGAALIKTANNDKTLNGSWWSFALSRESMVYVAFDQRATSVPAWLKGWELVTDTIWTSDVRFSLYRKPFAPGGVALGGNSEAPMSGAKSNYFVFAIPASTPSGVPGGYLPPVGLDWDARLTALHVYVEPAINKSGGYWKLVKARYENDLESGAKNAISVVMLDGNGAQVNAAYDWTVAWDGGQVVLRTPLPSGTQLRWSDYPLAGKNTPYDPLRKFGPLSAWVSEKSRCDVVKGLGSFSNEQVAARYGGVFRLVFQWVTK